MKSLKLKSALLVYFSLLITNYSFTQVAPGIEWQNTIGGNGSDVLTSLHQTTDGGYILGGNSPGGISGDITEAAVGLGDFWVVKLDNIGAIEWQNTIGGSGYDVLTSLQQTADGGYILGGYSSSGISGDKTEASMGSYDYWVLKLNSIGAIEWQNTIGGGYDDFLYSLQQTTDGGYILGGYSESGISGDKTEASVGLGVYFDYWVVKIDFVGNIEWQNTIGGSYDDYLQSIRQTSDGGYILGGFSDSDISGDKTEPKIGAALYANYDYWVLKLYSSGEIEWQNTIGGSLPDELRSIQQTSDGGYILGGNSESGISGDKTEANWNINIYFNTNDFWVVKLNSSGAIEWQNNIGGSGDDFFKDVEQTSDGGYILVGYSQSGISGDKSEGVIGGGFYSDFWVVKIDSVGIIQWENTIGGNSDDYLYCTQQTTDGGYILGGSSKSGISGDKTEANLGLYYTTDYWVVKLEACGSITEICNTLDDNCNGLIDDGITETISITAGGPTTFCQGTNVVLTAVHSGTSLQWKKNGVNIAGATGSTYTVTKTGEYTCETTSACGNGISNAIMVTVNKNPKAIIAADGPTTFCAGDDVTLTVTPVGGSTYQWYNGASAISGATTTSYVASTAGNYKCRVTKTATGCYKNSSVIAVAVTCREGEIITENTFQIYPNPADQTLTIETNLSTEKTIYITNTHGQLVQTIQSSENIIHIEIKDLASGMYFIKMEDGVYSTIQKFIKQ